MAHRRASIKKIRVDKRRYVQNLRIKSGLKSLLRKVTKLITEKAADAAKEASFLYSKLDKAVKKNIIHKNRASRLKSRISKKINSLKSQK